LSQHIDYVNIREVSIPYLNRKNFARCDLAW